MSKNVKTKVLATTLRKFNVTPLGNIKHETMTGEILPEANLIKNILERVYGSCIMVLNLLFFVRNSDVENIDPKARDSMRDFQSTVKEFSSTKDGQKLNYAAQKVLTQLRNDKILWESVRRGINASPSRPFSEPQNSFLKGLKKLATYSVLAVMTPFSTHVRNVSENVDNVALRIKYDKMCEKLRTELRENIATREAESSKKGEIISNLEKTIENVKVISNRNIQNFKEKSNRLMQREFADSEARICDVSEDIKAHKIELEEAIRDHSIMEDELREYNNRLEEEILAMIDSYDAKMFARHKEIESIKVAYDVEKKILERTLADLAILENEKSAIEACIEEEERERINSELSSIRKNVAAKVIQKAWRSYKTRQLLKSKKRKGKKKA